MSLPVIFWMEQGEGKHIIRWPLGSSTCWALDASGHSGCFSFKLWLNEFILNVINIYFLHCKSHEVENINFSCQLLRHSNEVDDLWFSINFWDKAMMLTNFQSSISMTEQWGWIHIIFNSQYLWDSAISFSSLVTQNVEVGFAANVDNGHIPGWTNGCSILTGPFHCYFWEVPWTSCPGSGSCPGTSSTRRCCGQRCCRPDVLGRRWSWWTTWRSCGSFASPLSSSPPPLLSLIQGQRCTLKLSLGNCWELVYFWGIHTFPPPSSDRKSVV